VTTPPTQPEHKVSMGGIVPIESGPKSLRHRGRPSRFIQALEMAKMTWAPVLEILGDDVLTEMDRVPYSPEPFHFNLGSKLIRTELGRAKDPERYRWLSPQEVLQVHEEMISRFGGARGVLNEGMGASALDRARHSEVYGHDPFPTIVHKAASIMHDILVYHPFADGQKRTGLSSAFIFLGLNGYSLWSRDPVDEVHFAVRVAKREFDVEAISKWLANRIAPPTNLGEGEIDLLLRRVSTQVRRCHQCRAYLSIKQHLVRCKRCGAEYVVMIRFGAVTRGGSVGRSMRATVGLVRREPVTAIQVRLDPTELELLMREVVGEGGWNSLVRNLQKKANPDGTISLSSEEVERIRQYSQGHGPGGFQDRLKAVLAAVERATPK
jgi:death on curing protein